MENDFTAHLRGLVRLALSDQKFSDIEKSLIFSIGKAHRLKEEEIEALIGEELNQGDATIEFQALTFDEKFEYLYDIIQLMKIDNEVYLSEIRFCEQIAEKLDFNKKVVKKIASRIYGDPSVTANRELLMREARKFANE